jgi:hypothetical protein
MMFKIINDVFLIFYIRNFIKTVVNNLILLLKIIKIFKNKFL